MKKRDIRKSRWFEEVAEYFDLEPGLVLSAVSPKRVSAADEPPAVREARARLRGMFMREESIRLLERLDEENPGDVSDIERSTAWREYIFACINGEKRAFERMFFYDLIIASVVKPMLDVKAAPLVVDYGSGSSLLTRLLAQDFGDAVRTVSVDACRYAVEFSVARNRLYNASAAGLLIEDVLAPLRLRDVDLILAYSVFEHLPNSTEQIQALIDALAPDGILIENYAGHSRETPHKSDTFSAYERRDINLDLLRERLVLLYGSLPPKRDGVYERDSRERYWIKTDANRSLIEAVQRRLSREYSVTKRLARKVGRLVGARV
ncbi:MAG: methyltransferase domain-containing protein [Candidatus Rokubacteria bacterium]|nr:methyltransferase domain-containing protein [Candidatus Rokubacteria bacterium]